ncbi:MAG: S8 family peptidase [Alishewanella aestuarii]
MKCIYTTLFAIAFSAVAITQANSQVDSIEERPQRLVVSFPLVSGSVTSQTTSTQQSEHCITLDSGTNWCVPVPLKSNERAAIHQATLQKSPLTSRAITVPAELTVSQAINLLSQTGFYSGVEPDVAISVQSWNETNPDEEYFDEQYYFQPNSVENPTGSSILTQWSMLKNPANVVNAYVLDTGFHLADDLDYAAGFNFENSQPFSKPGPGFLELEFIPEGATCNNMHGLGVASVIGAKINNGIGVTGTTGDVIIHPLRVMHCGTGFMSDAASALNWLSGQSVDGFPDFNGEPGVVNMSLGGKIGEIDCPLYLQSAIDNVTAKGFTVVVAAGNQSDNASLYIPAKCDKVITVGAATDKSRDADIAQFSNYGEVLDVMAVGQEVLGLRKDNGIGYWDGTSLASPLVAGMILNASKDFAFTPYQWQTLMPISSVNRWVEGARCETLGCAYGVLDAAKFYENAQRMQDGTLDSLTLSLNAVPACRQQWMIDNLPKGQTLCDQAVIELLTIPELAENEVIEVHALLDGQTIADRTGLVGQFQSTRFILGKAVFENRRAFAQKCDDNGQCELPIQLSTLELTNVPEACQ